MSDQQLIAESVCFIRGKTGQIPTVGLILGSGLGDFADNLPRPITLTAASIPNYPASTVEGHRGRLVFSTLDSGLTVVAFQGRVHFYESREVGTVTYPVRLAHALGVRTLVITNAAGGINREFSPGDLMLISDQLNLTSEIAHPTLPHPVRISADVYDPQLRSMLAEMASSMGIPLHSGVYAGVKGPSYETAAEVEMIRRVGGDVVGMSTVLEARLAAALGMRVMGISCITNEATGIGGTKLNHEEVTEVANRVRHDFAQLLNGLLIMLAR
ncbi:MAG: deoD1 [Bacteroidetes bacterium]|nr:deoD1 [Bacteroidota bacterium]